MKRMLQIILLLLVLAIALSGYSLWSNKVPWEEPPGFWPRLKVYLSQNVAQTDELASFPELRPRTYPIEAKQFLGELTQHIPALGWNLAAVDADKLEIQATVKTRWLGFTDDITLRLEPISKNQTRLHVRSASRVGRADYGANLGHIMRLYLNLQ
ncbi:MAG: DUF1499 domain-containing protein [Gammaproteobacteria bacterium]|nr:DUF1499 domain-containing protein [Gammaproteobacteria bacterium]